VAIRTFWRRQKSFATAGFQTVNHPGHSFVTILTVQSVLQTLNDSWLVGFFVLCLCIDTVFSTALLNGQCAPLGLAFVCFDVSH